MPSVSQGHSKVSINHFYFGSWGSRRNRQTHFQNKLIQKLTQAPILFITSHFCEKRKNGWISNHYSKRELELCPTGAVNTFPLFSKGHVSQQSSSHQVHPRFHAQRGVLSPCAFHSFPVTFVAWRLQSSVHVLQPLAVVSSSPSGAFWRVVSCFIPQNKGYRTK